MNAAAEAQLEVASHLAEAQQQLERAVQAAGIIFIWPEYVNSWRNWKQEMVRLSETV
jgi:hypothetical protein